MLLTYPAISLSDPAALTCIGNDYGFEKVFARQILDSTTQSNWRDISLNADQPICPIKQESFNNDEYE